MRGLLHRAFGGVDRPGCTPSVARLQRRVSMPAGADAQIRRARTWRPRAGRQIAWRAAGACASSASGPVRACAARARRSPTRCGSIAPHAARPSGDGLTTCRGRQPIRAHGERTQPSSFTYWKPSQRDADPANLEHDIRKEARQLTRPHDPSYGFFSEFNDVHRSPNHRRCRFLVFFE